MTSQGDDMSNDRLPDGFYKIEAYTNGYQIVILGHPPQDDELPEGAPAHNCDVMGCGSVGPHVVAYVPVLAPAPELEWGKVGTAGALQPGAESV